MLYTLVVHNNLTVYRPIRKQNVYLPKMENRNRVN